MKNKIKTNFPNQYFFNNTDKSIIYIPQNMNLVLQETESNNCSDAYYYKKINFLNNHQDLRIESKMKFETRYSEDYIKNKLEKLDLVCFEITQLCNLRCEYCTYSDLYQNNEERFVKTIELSAAYTLIDFLFDKWGKKKMDKNCKKTFSFYGGEALIKMHIIKDIVAYIKRKNSNYYKLNFNITTNGIFLKKHIRYLKENNFNIQVSLDGDEKGNAYRVNLEGKSVYQKLFHDLKTLRSEHFEYFTRKIKFHAVLNSNNSVYSLNRYFEENFPENEFSITGIAATGINEKKIEEFNRLKHDMKKNNIDRELYFKIGKKMNSGLFRSYSDLKRRVLSYNFSSPIEMLFNNSNNVSKPTGTCDPFDKLFLNTSGDILPCESVEDRYVFGKVLASGVKIDFTAIADIYEDNFNKIINKCSNCYYSNICESCVFLMDSKNGKHLCTNYMTKNRFLNNLTSLIQDVEVFGKENVLQ